MAAVLKWWMRIVAAVTGAVLTLVVPVHAWAATNGVTDVAVEAARYRRRGLGAGIFGLFGAVCCLFVVAVVLAVVLIVRRRRTK